MFIGVIIVAIIILALLILNSVSLSDPTNSQESNIRPPTVDGSRINPSEYPLLRENQIESFDYDIKKCSKEPNPTVKRYCYQAVDELIEIMSIKNAKYNLPNSKEYSLCHYLSNSANCLTEVAIEANDPEACNEIMNSLLIENMTRRENYRDSCLNQLE